MMTKSQIRECVKHQRKQLNADVIEKVSKDITRQIISLEAFEKAKTVFLYAAFKSEIQTKYLDKFARREGKKVAYPKIETSTGIMNFYSVRALHELETHTFKSMAINEPNPAVHVIIKPTITDLMIVPGVAFDLKGNRIGYGGGFYDRYLKECLPAYKIGVCMDFQIFDEVPAEPFDVKIDCIAADKRGICHFDKSIVQ